MISGKYHREGDLRRLYKSDSTTCGRSGKQKISTFNLILATHQIQEMSRTLISVFFLLLLFYYKLVYEFNFLCLYQGYSIKKVMVGMSYLIFFTFSPEEFYTFPDYPLPNCNIFQRSPPCWIFEGVRHPRPLLFK